MSYRVAQEIRARAQIAHDRQTLARALKVCAIVALVPAGATAADNETLAGVLASWPQGDRDRFAAAAGARTPSEETWRMVVEVVRLRTTPSETQGDAHARALPLLRVLQGGMSTGKLKCEGCGVSMDAPFELVGPQEQEFCEGCAKKYRNALSFQAGAVAGRGRS